MGANRENTVFLRIVSENSVTTGVFRDDWKRNSNITSTFYFLQNTRLKNIDQYCFYHLFLERYLKQYYLISYFHIVKKAICLHSVSQLLGKIILISDIYL